jgi:hypothetical protein
MLNLESREVVAAEIPFFCCVKRDCQLVHWHVGAITKEYLSAPLLDVTPFWNELVVTPWLLENVCSITLLSQSMLKISGYKTKLHGFSPQANYTDRATAGHQYGSQYEA